MGTYLFPERQVACCAIAAWVMFPTYPSDQSVGTDLESVPLFLPDQEFCVQCTCGFDALEDIDHVTRRDAERVQARHHFR
ncbi:hypothetical protein GCM10022404_07040 [Celeribacter arenosi]|uniref:Uncharacterized protein n=1 Tax=Celeribacter arenosi TaxID=792649 RepID=A0ABP7JZB0_9RHOB